MYAGLFIYFPRDLGHNIYFKVLTESTVRPLTKKGTSFKGGSRNGAPGARRTPPPPPTQLITS